jgi:folate-binding protein YgfZ
MTSARTALLADRGVVRVGGADAAHLLQGIICNDMDLLALQPAIHAGLLSPQGKILFEFFVVGTNEGYLLETRREEAGALVKRLAMYKLRAKATIEDASSHYQVGVSWGSSPAPQTPGTTAFADPRLPGLGVRLLKGRLCHPPAPTGPGPAAAEEWHALRITLGVPEGGRDYPLGDSFPHEADFDLLNGVSFTKGCFVGQEVVARMHNRSGVRKRVVPVRSRTPLFPGAEIVAGAAVIGRVGSVAGCAALAMLRLDRAAEAASKGTPLLAAGIEVVPRRPDWFVGDFPPVAGPP